MGHVLVVTELPPDDDYDYTLECDGNCDCYIECMEEHPCHDWDDCPTPPGEDCICDPYDGFEAEFHGVLHTFHWDFGWTVPFVGCGVKEFLWRCDSPDEIAREYGAGRWKVYTDWNDGHACLIYAGPESEGN